MDKKKLKVVGAEIGVPYSPSDFYKSLLDQIDHAILAIDFEGRTVHFNQMAETILGPLLVHEKVVWPTLFDPESKSLLPESHSPVMRTLQGVALKDEIYYLKDINHPEGLYIKVSSSQIGENRENPAGFLLQFSDITQHQRTLVESERRFRTVFDHAPIGIPVVSPSGKFLYANPVFQKMLDYSEEELKQLSVFDITFPEDHALTEKVIENLRGGRSKVQRQMVEKRYLAKNGKIVWARTVVSPVKSDSGDLLYSIVIVEDISVEKRAAEELRKTTETLHGLFQASPLAIISLDKTGVVNVWNSAAKTLFGWEESEVIGSMIPIVGKHQWIQSCELRKQLMLGEVGAGMELVRYRKDGTAINIGVFAFPQHDAQGEVCGITAFIQDITQRKKELAELRGAKEAAEEASHAKTEFLANISHEIRTPLGAILGFTEILRDSGLNESQRHWIESIRRNGLHLLSLIEDILDLSKVESGVMHIEKTWFSLSSEIEGVINSLRPQAERKGLAFALRYQTKVPQKIFSYAMGLRQILMNIIGNAIKFTEQGGIEVHIFFDERCESQIRILVMDSGIGIGPAQQQRLFKPFSQADSSTARKYGGTGLGLVLSKRMANALGGDLVLVKSAPNEGSCFEITLDAGPREKFQWFSPQSIEGRFRRREKMLIDTGHSENIHIDDLRILLIEDSQDNRVLLRHFLERAGGTVTEAIDGIQGVSMALGDNFDVVLMDIQMPGLDGYQATQKLRDSGYDKPIIALTAHAMVEERDRCLTAGCDAYLSKPVEPAQLISTVALYGRRENATIH